MDIPGRLGAPLGGTGRHAAVRPGDFSAELRFRRPAGRRLRGPRRLQT